MLDYLDRARDMSKMNARHKKKLKSLMAMMLRWAERDKEQFIGAKYNTWKKEFKYVVGLDSKLDMKYSTSLPRIHMIECNKLFKEYRC
jgi:glutamate synthase domain-containing protein 3